MNAVNLIPVEDRRGADAPGRSGGAVYAVLGALAVVLLLVAGLAITSKQVSDQKNQLAAVTAEAQTAESQAGSLQAYTQFASLRDKRQQTVAQLASSRFDWEHALHELARVVPDGTSLTTLRASVSPTVAVTGGTTDPLRNASNGPAIELSGCAPSQDGVAQLMAAMRRMDGVQRVSLSSSDRNPPAPKGSGSAAAAAGAGCTAGSANRTTFSMTIFYATPQVATPATGAAAGTSAASSTTTTTSSTTTTPATGGTK
jgi:Tfp pilus assembly protein PilN